MKRKTRTVGNQTQKLVHEQTNEQTEVGKKGKLKRKQQQCKNEKENKNSRKSNKN